MSGVPFLLLIEDDDAIRTGLELGLSRQGSRSVGTEKRRTATQRCPGGGKT